MADALFLFFRETLPEDLALALKSQLELLEQAKFEELLHDTQARKLLGYENDANTEDIVLKDFKCWSDYIFHRLEILLSKREESGTTSAQDSPGYRQHIFFITALAAIGAFLQSNVTGPPLPFSSPKFVLPVDVASDPKLLSKVRRTLIEFLRADGEAAYRLTPNVELFCLADAILTHPAITKNIPAAKWARLRVDFLHQRLLSEIAPSLEKSVYDAIRPVQESITSGPKTTQKNAGIAFLLEKATIHTFHGHDKLAREALDLATKERGFEFALTGLMGKRTKFQQQDVSQLVVLARSAEDEVKDESAEDVQRSTQGSELQGSGTDTKYAVPKALELNDDTVLESISFTKPPKTSADVKDESTIPARLTSLNPEKQPILNPFDSIILLSLASSITNTNPASGITREETAPYATRVVEGGSSNWQVYTHALLLRSRIEGYKSRTVERGLLQLQALVDQVIADTASAEENPNQEKPEATTFLPKAKESESAPASQRLAYVFQLCSPSRWELEAELAVRWTSLGGLRSALEIYERLEMWPEAALCWAATDRDDKARKIVRRQLFHATDDNDETIDADAELWNGKPREPPPSEAPRLYCILADIDKDPSLFEKAWEVSNQRYARAQRSLGRHYYGLRDYAKASLAFSKALKVKQLDHGTWFALGCALIELEQFKRAVEAFSRAVQLDDTDGESWSNLAAALLNLGPEEDTPVVTTAEVDEDEDGVLAASPRQKDPQQHNLDALSALKHAARLKHDNHRIWENLLTVAASLTPPSWSDIVVAQKRIIDLRGSTDGEKCVDIPILTAVVNHVIATSPTTEDLGKPGLPKMVIQLMERDITPLITSSAPLWRLMSTLALARNRPSAALTAQEKAWRSVVTQPGWETGKEEEWNGVVEATLDLVGAYESFGPRERTEGLASGVGEVVMKEWKFKARSAVRGIMGRGRDSWEGTQGWDRLVEGLEGLKGS